MSAQPLRYQQHTPGRPARLVGGPRPLRPRSTPAAGSETPAEKPQTRILVVDDQPDAAIILGELLIDLGHSVAIAHSGATALDIASSFEPDIALLDLRLPAMDGYELAARLKAQLTKPVRLVAVTGYGPGSDASKVLRAGFEAYLVKPVTLDQLKAVIRAR